MFILNWIEVSVRLIRIENFVAVHHCHQILGIAEVDDVVRIARKHVHRLDVVAAHLKLNNFVRAFLALLNQPVTFHDDEKFPF